MKQAKTKPKKNKIEKKTVAPPRKTTAEQISAKTPKITKDPITKTLFEDVISEVAGPDVLPLVKSLKNKSNISEFKLASTLRQEINTVRNMLYRLYNANLVTFIRKKDQKKGWYIYYWTFNTRNIHHLAEEIKKKKVEKITERLTREKNSLFYLCKNKCLRLEFEQAADFEFKCPECGSLLDQEDNRQKIQTLQQEMDTLQKKN